MQPRFLTNKLLQPYFKLHLPKLFLLLVIANGLLVLSLSLGNIKAWSEIDWLDILGEGGAVLISLTWIGLLLNSRPRGRVTNILTTALGCIFIATWQDALDEVIRLPESAAMLDSLLEGIPMPVGMMLLTYGLFHWHREQLAINEQLIKREQMFREHETIDPITQLASASFLKAHLNEALEQHLDSQQPLAVLLLDINDFDSLNRQHGQIEGDRMLQQIAELILLNLRRCDLLCRYAGDRFAVVLPNTGETVAQVIAEQLNQAVKHFAFKTQPGETVYRQATITYCVAQHDTPESILAKLNKKLEQEKEKRDVGLYAA
ncbi:MAG: GGDEF domain-containing protein [Pseudomonadales bacterium]|nr:GGDEF domain-containing protein [Pseudomonadales bacterium]